MGMSNPEIPNFERAEPTTKHNGNGPYWVLFEQGGVRFFLGPYNRLIAELVAENVDGFPLKESAGYELGDE